jgi:DNA-binding transcriptional ArsR family regulator
MIEQITRAGKALSDGGRVRILLALVHQGDLCACELARMLGLTPATVSRHMEILLDTGFVSARKESRWVHYRVETGTLPEGLIAWITVTGEEDPRVRNDRKGDWKNNPSF